MMVQQRFQTNKKKVLFVIFAITILAASFWFLRYDICRASAYAALESTLASEFTREKVQEIRKHLKGPTSIESEGKIKYQWSLPLSKGDTARISVSVGTCPLKINFYDPGVTENNEWYEMSFLRGQKIDNY